MCQTTRSSTMSPQEPAEARADKVGSTSGHPVSLEDFYRTYPSFVWGPLVVSGALFALAYIPVVSDYLKYKNMEAFGFFSALHYTAFAILLSFAFHGWSVVFAPDRLKIQSSKSYALQPNAMVVRSTATLFTELVYTFMPLAPVSSSWLEFAAWTAAANVYWDAHFYVVHRFAHEHKAAYKFLHKTHHLCKDPNCFSAYFVTYQSHVLTEQLVVLILAMAGLPRDVFCFLIYWGTFDTYVEHCGYELGKMKLPFLPFTLGNLSSVIGLPTFFLPGVSVADHDWHHEKFFDNYALSYRYLDKLLGTYKEGRVPNPKSE